MKNPPPNFSWLDNFIAGSSKPTHLDHIDYFINVGITHLISLTTEIPLVMTSNSNKLTHIHIPMYAVPNDQQLSVIQDTLKEIKKNSGKVVVHCQFGQERTGIVLALYLISEYNMAPKEAIIEVRKKRPKSLRSDGAIAFILNLK